MRSFYELQENVQLKFNTIFDTQETFFSNLASGYWVYITMQALFEAVKVVEDHHEIQSEPLPVSAFIPVLVNTMGFADTQLENFNQDFK